VLFNTYTFLVIFLPVVLVTVALLRRFRMGRLVVPFLSLSSFAFYAYWDPRYVPLLLGSVLFNYVVGSVLAGDPPAWSRRGILVAGLVGNLGLLGYFKYAGFFARNVNALSGSDLSVPALILPLGISFFTFTQIEYLVDAYRGSAPRYGPIEYSLFVTFFPHLIAGPILRHHQVIPQFRELSEGLGAVRPALATGLLFLSVGLFKKTIIADSLAPWVNAAFGNVSVLTLVDSWAAALAYTFQLYFDFSGYSDMAYGVAIMLGVAIPINFESPYKSASIGEFWRRWHISLSTFLREYLYFPLGGSRRGRVRNLLNLFLTMLLGGLWHGAGWTFVFWGAWHGALLAVHRAWAWTGRSLNSVVAGTLTFVAVVIGWVLFRAGSLSEALTFFLSMGGRAGIALPTKYAESLASLSGARLRFGSLSGLPDAQFELRLAALAALVLFVVYLPNTRELAERARPQLRWALFTAVLFVSSFLMIGGRVTHFLYYQF